MLVEWNEKNMNSLKNKKTIQAAAAAEEKEKKKTEKRAIID